MHNKKVELIDREKKECNRLNIIKIKGYQRISLRIQQLFDLIELTKIKRL